MKPQVNQPVPQQAPRKIRRKLTALAVAAVTLLATGCELWSTDFNDYRSVDGVCQPNKSGSCF